MGMMPHALRHTPVRSLLKSLLMLLTVWSSAVAGVKLRVHNSECITEVINERDSLVTVSVVTSEFRGEPSYFDFLARDPQGVEIYSRKDIDSAEMAFNSRIEGPHSFCFSVAAQHQGAGVGSSSPRVSKKLREVSVDIQVGEIWTHDRVKSEHLDELMEDISKLKIRVQKLKSEVRYLKFREIRQKRTVQSTSRRVTRYSLVKMVTIIIIAVAQPMIISVFFKNQFKY